MTKRGFVSLLVVCVGVIVILMVLPARAQAFDGTTPILTVNGLAAAEPLIIEGKDEIIIRVAGAAEVNEQGCSVVCEGEGVLEPLAEPDSSVDEPVSAYRFLFGPDRQIGEIMLVAEQDMVIDGTIVSAGSSVYKLVLFYCADTDVTTVVGIGLEVLSRPASEPQTEEAPAEAVGTSQEQAQPTAEEPQPLPTPVAPGQPEKVLLYSPAVVDGLQTVCLSRTGCDEFVSTGKEGVDGERTGWAGWEAPVGTGGVVEVSGDVTTNQIWTADNTYHIIGDVNVQALLVIEPGTIVEFAADKWMAVNNGGTLISVGLPDNPIIYTSDSATPAYEDYYCPLYVEETASPSTKITYSYVEYAYIGIMVLNNRLEADIENNWLYNNVYGIVEFGTEHTDICNNVVFASYYYGIEVFMESPEGYADANSSIVMQNNTCDYYQDVGILVHGVDDADDAGSIGLINNIVSASWMYGLVLADGYGYATITNTGYYGNAADKNWDFYEENPVFETLLPYETGAGPLPICYLRQDCNFINTGYEYIEQTRLIGKTTDVNSFPDRNYTDLGFHYPNWDFSNAGDGSTLDWDLTGNLIVDSKDYAIFANGWRTIYDINDLAAFTTEWLESISGHPQISVAISGDPCNLSGDIEIGINGYGYQTEQVFVLIDGRFSEELFGFDDNHGVELASYSLSSGQHSIKVVTVEPNDIVTVSPPLTVWFDNELYYACVSDSYEQGEDYCIAAMYSGGHNLRVDVADIEDNVVWSDTFSGHLNVAIPGGVFDSNGLYEVSINETGILLEDYESWIKKVGKKFKPGDANPNAKGLIVCPDKAVTKGKYTNVQSAIKAFEQKGIEYIVLYRGNATYANVGFCLTELPVKHLYFIGHGDDRIGDMLRTAIKLADGTVVSLKASDYYPDDPPPFCEDMGKWESKVKSVLAMGIPPGKIKIAFIDSCHSGRLRINSSYELVEGPKDDPGQMDPSPGDMSGALGMVYDDQIYKGWWGKSFAINELTYYISWSNNFWDRLRLGDSIYEAIDHCIWHVSGIGLPYGPHHMYRLRGYGNIYAIKLLP